ncbi:ankyrin repeat protein SKIP35 isoform X2 [Physcomitrium patens]|nr:ankyrin repeat protein SKIP35-like isoform X2 [Physcomitrium patens]XP_024372326.1 ankyrin repeat protein SKIP35-like isoform X2 [Physcomitrium patens]|eukprot:XP_024372325.1 ankyrin repeat protein SKIP35-like isoform X2 [Physcomitrella patens]
MTCAGWSGHVHVVDALIKLTRSVSFGAAFVGALVGLQKDMVDHVVHVADKHGLDKCLLMGAARIWSCSTVEEVKFLLYAIQRLVDAGAKSFQRAMQVSCGDAVIEYWNGDIFMHKAQILQRLVVLGSNHLTPDFFGRILLMICVTFLCKLRKCHEKTCEGPAGITKQYCKSGEDLRCATIVQDMINVLSVVCKNGAADLISSRLLDVAYGSFDDIRRLLHIFEPHLETCSSEWPLKMLQFMLIDCGIKDLSPTVTTLPAFQAARLNVLLPVVKCFFELQCFDAAYVYLDLSITFCQIDAIRYILRVIPKPPDTANLIQAVRAAASNTRGPPRGPQGVLCALHSNFLCNETETLAEAAKLAELPETDVSVKMALRSEWSQQAFNEGIQAGQRHFLNWMLVRKHALSPLRVGELPLEIQVAIGYFPLYRDCLNTPGSLISQRQRGEVVVALQQLCQGSGKFTYSTLMSADKRLLLSLLAAHLPAWCRSPEFKRRVFTGF